MPINIEMSKDSPRISLDEQNSTFLIEGSSYMPDAYKAYKVVLDWIDEHLSLIKDLLICEFKFNMLSSASRKMIYEILSALNQSSSGENKVHIHWYYADYDEDMKDIGEIYQGQLNLPFDFFPTTMRN
jgi:hypothetical protein